LFIEKPGEINILIEISAMVLFKKNDNKIIKLIIDHPNYFKCN